MSRQTYSRIERVIIGLMLIGMVGMFQPFAIALYRYGFLLLLLSTIGFIIVSHLSPKPEAPDPGPISLGQAAEHIQGHE
jgi:hypothetical protein